MNQQQQRPAPLGLNNLQWDMKLCIADFLDPESTMALALTSKRLFWEASHTALRRLQHDAGAKGRLLQLLEKDHPEFLSCRCCNKLYNWTTQRSVDAGYGHADCHIDTGVSCREYVDHSALLNGACSCPDAFRGTMAQCDLVMRACERGPRHGMPLEYIRHECTAQFRHRFGSREYAIDKRMEGTIVDGDLVVHSTFELTFDRLNVQKDEMGKLAQLVCPDATNVITILAQCAWKHIEDEEAAEQEGNSGDEPEPERLCRRRLKCDHCSTEYQLTLEQSRSPRTILVSLNTWQNFGSRSQMKIDSGLRRQRKREQETVASKVEAEEDPYEDISRLWSLRNRGQRLMYTQDGKEEPVAWFEYQIVRDQLLIKYPDFGVRFFQRNGSGKFDQRLDE